MNIAQQTYVSSNILKDVRLQWHVHIHGTDNETELGFNDLQHSRNENRIPCSGLEVERPIAILMICDLPATVFHRLFARSSTDSLSSRSLTKYMLAY
jgi:hypothetical protein